MTLTRMHFIVAFVWFSLLLGIVGISVVVGIAPTLSDALMFFLLGCIPVTALYRVFRGAPPRSVAEILHVSRPRIVRR